MKISPPNRHSFWSSVGVASRGILFLNRKLRIHNLYKLAQFSVSPSMIFVSFSNYLFIVLIISNSFATYGRSRPYFIMTYPLLIAYCLILFWQKPWPSETLFWSMHIILFFFILTKQKKNLKRIFFPFKMCLSVLNK